LSHKLNARIRPFAVAHIPAALALWRATPGVGERSGRACGTARYLARNPGLSLVAESEPDGQLIGTLLCGHDGRRGLIHHLVVAPGHRRQRIGERLVSAGLQGLHARIGKCHGWCSRTTPRLSSSGWPGAQSDRTCGSSR
jgi:ribosomal protein S18 acetylase RimI-like enzyme